MTQALYLPGPGAALTLPDDAAVIRCLAGDGLGAGASGAITTVASLGETHVRGGAAAGTAIERTNAYYWGKWFMVSSDEWTAEFRNTWESEAENTWLALHDRTGYHEGPAGATYAALGDAPSLGLLWCLHYFANAMPRYRMQSGPALPIHYVQHGTPASYVGAYATDEELSWAPSHNAGLFELWQEHYLAAAVNALRAAGKQVFIESMFFTGGGADGDDAVGTPGGANLGENLEKLLHAMGTRSGGRIPTVLVRPYESVPATYPDWEDAQTSFDAQFDAFGDPFTDYIRMEGVPRVETWPGIHPTSDGLVVMAQRYADAVNRLASRGARLVKVTEDLA